MTEEGFRAGFEGRCPWYRFRDRGQVLRAETRGITQDIDSEQGFRTGDRSSGQGLNGLVQSRDSGQRFKTGSQGKGSGQISRQEVGQGSCSG